MEPLRRGLDAAWTRNAVIRNNIANVETPNFKASEVEFESLLARSLQASSSFQGAVTHPRHIEFSSRTGPVTHRIVQRRDTSMRLDGNNVDIEAENVRLAQNSIWYNTIVEQMNGEIRRLRMAIQDTR
jgi:flagellar basal-body rod protein FlgB